MIQKVSYRNFKVLRQVDIDLERFTVIVGPNASGKTSLLEGLHLMFGRHFTDYLKQIRGSEDPLCFHSRNPRGQMELSFQTGENQYRFLYSRKTTTPANSSEKRTECQIDILEKRPEVADWKQIPDPKRALRFGSSVFLRLDSSRLATPSYSEDAKPQFGVSGEGLPSFLAFMALNRPDAFSELQFNLRRVIPTLKRIRFDRIPITKPNMILELEKKYVADSLVFDFAGATDVPGTMASQGTILVLGLLAALFESDSPTLILLDDLEQGLHPKAQKQLVEVIRTILEDKPELQIVATAHSPYLLDHFRPEEVRITALQEDGTAVCGRLDQHPDFEKWKDEMAPGEFWSLIGENWLKNIRPEATADAV